MLNQVLVRFGTRRRRSDATDDRVIDAVQRSGECWMGGTTWHGHAPHAHLRVELVDDRARMSTGRSRRSSPPSPKWRSYAAVWSTSSDRRDRCRSAEEIALSVPASQIAQRVELLVGLDSLRDDFDVYRSPERDDGAQHLAAADVENCSVSERSSLISDHGTRVRIENDE